MHEQYFEVRGQVKLNKLEHQTTKLMHEKKVNCCCFSNSNLKYECT